MKNKLSTKNSLPGVLKVSALLAAVTSVAVGIGYFFAMRGGFDFSIGHFDTTPWFYLFSAGLVVCALIALFCAIKCRGNGVRVKEKMPLSEKCVRLVCAALAFFIFALFLVSVFSHHEPYTKIEKISGILTVFIGLAFMSSALTSKESAPLNAVLFILAALAVNFNIFADYFDFSIPVNSPVRNVSTVMHCAVLLFMIAEARLYLPNESGRSTAVFAAFTYLFTFASCFGIPLAEVIFRKAYPNPADPNFESGRLLLFLGISVLALFRFVSIADNLCSLPEKEKKKEKSHKS